MGNSLNDVFSALQNGVVALNGLVTQTKGSFNNISGQLTNLSSLTPLSSQVATLNAEVAAFRTPLSGNTTLYVASSGSDANSGSSVAPFATIQKGVNVGLTYDMKGFGLTIQVADGAYAAGFILTSPFVGGLATVKGNLVTPSNVLIQPNTTNNIFSVDGLGVQAAVEGFRLSSTGANVLVSASNRALLNVVNAVDFGSAPGGQHVSTVGGIVSLANSGGTYTISGSANYHIRAVGGGWLIIM